LWFTGEREKNYQVWSPSDCLVLRAVSLPYHPCLGALGKCKRLNATEPQACKILNSSSRLSPCHLICYWSRICKCWDQVGGLLDSVSYSLQCRTLFCLLPTLLSKIFGNMPWLEHFLYSLGAQTGIQQEQESTYLAHRIPSTLGLPPAPRLKEGKPKKGTHLCL
jgi:hypothetical protein